MGRGFQELATLKQGFSSMTSVEKKRTAALSVTPCSHVHTDLLKTGRVRRRRDEQLGAVVRLNQSIRGH
ncbi:hypothetical protein Q7C36_014295 [Tachysurus vachellii]|uniref:Uncharacterized protein n=1 Tax=Tachysurus vachellii TaxID=175792 RepID=A0AA88SEI4_TACVA|nr:hypothetical protein Q7C36_014295 [Tachysurus vachellii]